MHSNYLHENAPQWWRNSEIHWHWGGFYPALLAEGQQKYESRARVVLARRKARQKCPRYLPDGGPQLFREHNVLQAAQFGGLRAPHLKKY
jgi:hypothetical protein